MKEMRGACISHQIDMNLSVYVLELLFRTTMGVTPSTTAWSTPFGSTGVTALPLWLTSMDIPTQTASDCLMHQKELTTNPLRLQTTMNLTLMTGLQWDLLGDLLHL